jgi:SRSO17 transposase
MAYELDEAGKLRLRKYFDDTIGPCLRDKRQRASYAIYALGILGEGERKSCEPIAARACGTPREVANMHSQLVYFLRSSPWDARLVRLVAAKYAIAALEEREPVTNWVLDDTGFLKQGTHSVGVQRQYTGSAGKTTNCQVGVSLSVATRTAHVPVDFELYLPASWTENAERRVEAKIPEEVTFQTKIELALKMIERAIDAGLPGEVLLADSAYGESHPFRETVRLLGLDYALGIHAPTKVWLLDAAGRRHGDAVSAEALGQALGPRAFRRVTWREGTGKKLHSRFCFRRVKVACNDGIPPAKHEAVWLMSEWPLGEPKPTKFALTTLPRRMSKKRIVRTVKERWRTEYAYEELKGELGLDHFEGRSFPGWHHHVSVVLSCYAFVIAERVRHFPPSAGRQARDAAFDLAA